MHNETQQDAWSLVMTAPYRSLSLHDGACILSWPLLALVDARFARFSRRMRRREVDAVGVRRCQSIVK